MGGGDEVGRNDVLVRWRGNELDSNNGGDRWQVTHCIKI
jgi:hypothetical protein